MLTENTTIKIVAHGWEIGARCLTLKSSDRQEALDYAEHLQGRGCDVVIYRQQDASGDLFHVYA